MNNDTQVPTLTDFLLARIAEDEALAPWIYLSERYDEYLSRESRVLVECEAKRRIVGLHAKRRHTCVASWDEEDQGAYWPFSGEPGGNGLPLPYCPTLRALALLYAAHPDYRKEWRP